MKKEITPIFIFSLPRSGSTLVQEILMNTENISSHSETWSLLPIIYATKKEGSLTLYSHEKSFLAHEDFINSFPNKKEDHNTLIRNYFTGIVKYLSAPDVTYFVEKTPRNYLIIDEIAEIFPNAKFIFLFRNPLGIISSLLKTKRSNRFRTFYNAKTDLFDAPKKLSEGYEKYSERSIKIVYDDLVSNPEKTIKQLAKYLDLDPNSQRADNIELGNLSGRLGDPNIKNRKKIDTNSINVWKVILNNPLRKRVLFKYLKGLDERYVLHAGLSKKQLVNSLKKNKSKQDNFLQLKKSLIDVFDVSYAYLVYKFKLEIFFKKGNKWLQKSSLE